MTNANTNTRNLSLFKATWRSAIRRCRDIFRAYTPYKIAHELLRWDQEFKDANYTSSLRTVPLWQSSSRD